MRVHHVSNWIAHTDPTHHANQLTIKANRPNLGGFYLQKRCQQTSDNYALIQVPLKIQPFNMDKSCVAIHQSDQPAWDYRRLD